MFNEVFYFTTCSQVYESMNCSSTSSDGKNEHFLKFD